MQKVLILQSEKHLAGMTLEEKAHQKLRKRLQQKLNRACAEYGLIEDGDHILVGLSGGKDSLALVELLGARQKIFVPHFKVSATYVSMSNIGYKSDLDYLREFCETAGVDFHHVETSFDERVDAEDAKQMHRQKTHCFLCSWYRRKALFDKAKELGCNKIALGHHKDDIVETLLLNLVYQGSFSTIAPRLQMERFPMTVVRPLCLIEEKELAEYAESAGYKKVDRQCPYERESARAAAKKIVGELEQLNPAVRDSLWGAMHNVKEGYLPRRR